MISSGLSRRKRSLSACLTRRVLWDRSPVKDFTASTNESASRIKSTSVVEKAIAKFCWLKGDKVAIIAITYDEIKAEENNILWRWKWAGTSFSTYSTTLAPLRISYRWKCDFNSIDCMITVSRTCIALIVYFGILAKSISPGFDTSQSMPLEIRKQSSNWLVNPPWWVIIYLARYYKGCGGCQSKQSFILEASHTGDRGNYLLVWSKRW